MAAINVQEDYVSPPSGFVITHDGLFDLEGFHEKVKRWYIGKRYTYTEKEVQIKHKAQGNEIVFGFNGDREIDDFFRFHINYKVFSIRTRKVKEGYVGWIKINVVAYIHLDWKNRWQKNPWERFLFFVYVNFIIKNRIQRIYESKLYLEMLESIGVAKSCLGAYH